MKKGKFNAHSEKTKKAISKSLIKFLQSYIMLVAVVSELIILGIIIIANMHLHRLYKIFSCSTNKKSTDNPQYRHSRHIQV